MFYLALVSDEQSSMLHKQHGEGIFRPMPNDCLKQELDWRQHSIVQLLLLLEKVPDLGSLANIHPYPYPYKVFYVKRHVLHVES